MDGTQSPTNSRKRPREHETESQKIKREKAAERQRRKRERDRANAQSQASIEAQEAQGFVQAQAQVQQVVVHAAGMAMLYAPPDQQHIHLQHHPMAHQLVHPQSITMPPNMNEYHREQQEQQEQQEESVSQGRPQLTQEEADRRDKVRSAARERQRKHRALVRERKMREMGVDMEEGVDGVEDALRYQAAEYMPLQHSLPPMEPPFPGVAQGLGGQTFASTLLLSFSCAPLLKAHLLRTLNMTNEELASLEPVIAEAWDRWNSQRTIQYAEAHRTAHAQQQRQQQQQQQSQQQPPPPNNISPTFSTIEAPSQPNSQPQPPAQPPQNQPQSQPQPQAVPGPPPPTVSHPPPPTFAHTNGPDISSLDFRNRFSHQLTRPVPSFSPAFADASRTNGSNSVAPESIDPHLTNGTSTKTS